MLRGIPRPRYSLSVFSRRVLVSDTAWRAGYGRPNPAGAVSLPLLTAGFDAPWPVLDASEDPLPLARLRCRARDVTVDL